MVTRWMDKWVERSLRVEREAPPRWLFVLTFIGFGLVLVALTVVQLNLGWWSSLASLFVAMAAGSGLAGPLIRRRAYQAGHSDGRVAAFESAVEAAKRGMSPMEWVLLEIERDMAQFEDVDPSHVELARLLKGKGWAPPG